MTSDVAALRPGSKTGILTSHDSSLEIAPITLDVALQEARETFNKRFTLSKSHYDEAVNFLPGGNTRSVLFTEPFPVFMKKGRGNRLWDCDGNEYLDLVCELTAGLYGHSNPILKEAMMSTYDNIGVSLGATSTHEVALAKLLCHRFLSLDRVRFCNSGTEANIYALSIARHYTAKRKVLVFRGGYHGGVLSFGHGTAANTVDREDYILCEYNDTERAEEIIKSTPDLAAVLVEAMQGAGGCIVGDANFLKTIETTAKSCGVIFILDEVMTSRLHPGGLQNRYGLDPDLTTLGKYIGGGLAFGAFGGKKHLMKSYDPRQTSSLPHSGTFNNNTLAMVCGYTGLSCIYTDSANQELNALGDYLRQSLLSVFRGTKMVASGIGAVCAIHFLSSGEPPMCERHIEEYSLAGGLKKLLWHWCLERGYWITERGMVSIILGTSHSEIDGFIMAVQLFIEHYRHLLL